MSSRKTVLVVTGSLFAFVAMGLLIAGGVLIGISETRSDPDGYLTSPTFELSTDTHALTSEQLDLRVVRNEWLPASWLATVKLSAASPGDVPVFVGIGPVAEVDAYLEGVAHSEVTWNSNDDPVYLPREGENAPGVPAKQDFWITSSEGLDPQSIVWDVEPGQWTVLIMNADATPDVTVDVSAGVRTPWLIIVAVGLLGAGTLCLVTGSVLMFFGLRHRAATQQRAPNPGTSEEPTVSAGTNE